MKRSDLTVESDQHKRALELAIINAFFLPGSAAHFATVFSTGAKKLSAGDVTRIWAKAKDNGELPKINRPHNGPKDRERVRA